MAVTIDHQAVTEGLPTTWTSMAKRLGTTRQQLRMSRQALDMMHDPITAESLEKLRRITLFCQQRNKGGGGDCTRRRYVGLLVSGEIEDRLKSLKII